MSNDGVIKGDAVMRILHGHQGTLSEAVERIGYIDFGTKADMKETIAYLACQVSAYRQIANEEAALALSQIKHIADAYAARKANL